MVQTDGRAAGDVLRLSGISKTFPGGRVLHDVDLALSPGEVRALVGENGSGKSTLVKILAGYHQPDHGGQIEVAGQQLALHHDGAAEVAGVRFVHQDLGLVGSLTTVENLGLGRGYGNRRGAPVRWSRQRAKVRQTLRDLGYDFDVDIPVALLGASERTAVAVARAISPHRTEPRVLVLDEPTANLPGPEIGRLFDLVRRITSRGMAVLFISHHLGEVFELADTVTVLRGGRLVMTGPVAGLDEGSLIELMVGHRVDRAGPASAPLGGPVALEVERLSGRSLATLDFDVRAGEVLGIAGITGSGREEVAALLFGAVPRGGRVVISGQPLPPRRPDESVARGMALVPADRNSTAVIDGHTVLENLTIARLKDFAVMGWIRRRAERTTTAEWLESLDVRPRRPGMPMVALSGGNAQKVVMARWLRLEPKILVLDEPTQGVDVGAKEDIHRRVDAAAARGAAVVVCSTDSEELARLCHRILVLVKGRRSVTLTAPFAPDEITVHSIAAGVGE